MSHLVLHGAIIEWMVQEKGSTSTCRSPLSLHNSLFPSFLLGPDFSGLDLDATKLSNSDICSSSSSSMAEDNWDLQAVVRSYVGGLKTSTVESSSMSRNPPSYLQLSSSPSLILRREDTVVAGDDALLSGFQDLLANPTTVLQELHDLCKPFSSRTPSLLPSSHQLKQNKILPFPSLASQLRKRKSQQIKKVICHVPVGDHSDDKWAWRKYGQKPIKGSPFPRGYYRCSSTKSCVARKQVERSRTDPGVYVITYASEHNHPPPTHRNPLSRSTRKKLLSSSATNDTAESTTSEVRSSLSPTTPLTVLMEEEEEDNFMFLS